MGEDGSVQEVRHVQIMHFADHHAEADLRGKSKGIRINLEERGLWPSDSEADRPLLLDCALCRLAQKDDLDRHQRTACCARRLLANQPDFLEQKLPFRRRVSSWGFKLSSFPSFTAKSISSNICGAFPSESYGPKAVATSNS